MAVAASDRARPSRGRLARAIAPRGARRAARWNESGGGAREEASGRGDGPPSFRLGSDENPQPVPIFSRGGHVAPPAQRPARRTATRARVPARISVDALDAIRAREPAPEERARAPASVREREDARERIQTERIQMACVASYRAGDASPDTVDAMTRVDRALHDANATRFLGNARATDAPVRRARRRPSPRARAAVALPRFLRSRFARGAGVPPFPRFFPETRPPPSVSRRSPRATTETTASITSRSTTSTSSGSRTKTTARASRARGAPPRDRARDPGSGIIQPITFPRGGDTHFFPFVPFSPSLARRDNPFADDPLGAVLSWSKRASESPPPRAQKPGAWTTQEDELLARCARGIPPFFARPGFPKKTKRPLGFRVWNR